MDDLIKALQILKEYMKDSRWPTHCEHDTLMVCGVDTGSIPKEVVDQLDDLGFFISEEYDDAVISFRFGSC